MNFIKIWYSLSNTTNILGLLGQRASVRPKFFIKSLKSTDTYELEQFLDGRDTFCLLTKERTAMKKGGAVLIIIGGSIGIIEAITLILGGAINLRLGEDYSGLLFIMGWVGLLCSLSLVILGSFVIRTSELKNTKYSLCISIIAVLLAAGVFVTILITDIEPDNRSVSFNAIGILWASGWYIGTFLVFGVVGSILATFGITLQESEPKESMDEVQTAAEP